MFVFISLLILGVEIYWLYKKQWWREIIVTVIIIGLFFYLAWTIYTDGSLINMIQQFLTKLE